MDLQPFTNAGAWHSSERSSLFEPQISFALTVVTVYEIFGRILQPQPLQKRISRSHCKTLLPTLLGILPLLPLPIGPNTSPERRQPLWLSLHMAPLFKKSRGGTTLARMPYSCSPATARSVARDCKLMAYINYGPIGNQFQ